VIFVNERNTDSFKADFLSNHFTVKEEAIYQVNGYRNAFRPEAKVLFQNTPTGTKNIVIIKPNLGVIIFVSIAILVFLLAVVSFVASSKNDYRSLSVPSLIVPLILYFVATSAFNSELGKLELFVSDLLEIE